MRLSEKESLRERGRAIRKGQLSPLSLSARICERIKDWNVFASARRIMSYSAIDGEVDLLALNAASLDRELYLPALVAGEKGLEIEARRFLKDALCEPGKFGIKEAPGGAPVINPAELELILVPGIMFSRGGGRIGFGYGYYDRFLTSCSKALKAGVCFEAQFGEDFELGEDDVKMDFVITEKEIWDYGDRINPVPK